MIATDLHDLCIGVVLLLGEVQQQDEEDPEEQQRGVPSLPTTHVVWTPCTQLTPQSYYTERRCRRGRGQGTRTSIGE